MDITSLINIKDENGNFDPAKVIGQLDKLEPMLPMLDGLMNTYKPAPIVTGKLVISIF